MYFTNAIEYLISFTLIAIEVSWSYCIMYIKIYYLAFPIGLELNGFNNYNKLLFH